MVSQDNKTNKLEEVDLTQFFNWIGRGFARLGRGFISSLATLRSLFYRNLTFFCIIIFLGLILGALYSELLNKKYYKSTMVLGCDYLNTQILSNTIVKLNLLADEGGEGLSEELKLDLATASNIQRFEFKPFISEDDIVELEVLKEQLNNLSGEKKDLVTKVIKKLEFENKDAYQISVLVYTPDIVKPLEKALVRYFRENEYIKRRIDNNKLQLNSRKQKLITESRKLDSLKNVVMKNLEVASRNRGSNNVILNDESLHDPLQIFVEDLKLNEEILGIEQKLYIHPEFEVVDGFTTFKLPESASFLKILISSFLGSIFMGYLILGAREFDKMLAKYPSRNNIDA